MSDDIQRGPVGQRGIERAIAMLRILADNPAGLTLSDLARRADVPLTTAHRIVGVLQDSQLVRETPSGMQALGVGTVILAGSFLDGLDIRAEARPALIRLSEKLGETCHLGVLASAEIVYLDKIDSAHPVRMVSRVGGTNPALTTAIGRSILAFSPHDRLSGVIAASRQMYGSSVEVSELDAALSEVVARGYSTDLEVNERGICCVGAPIFSHTGEAVGGISVSTPTSRFRRKDVPRLGALVRAEADEVSRALGWLPGKAGAWKAESL